MDDSGNDAQQMDSEESGEKKGLTRRAFLGHAAVGAAAVGIGSTLLGAPAAVAGTYTTNVPKKWSKTYDVVVIGTGVGLAAAIEAKKAGASVLILEKADHVGGLYITAGGSFSMGGNNIVQQAAAQADPANIARYTTPKSSGSRTRCTAPTTVRSQNSCARSCRTAPTR